MPVARVDARPVPSMAAGLQHLSFPALDSFLGSSAVEFFSREWQTEICLFPEKPRATRLSTADFDFRAVVAKAQAADKLELLGGKDSPGPKPGDPAWPGTPNAVSARVTRADDFARPLSGLCKLFTEETSHRVHANLYVSPPQSRGLDRHQDGHDVLILQVEGSKRWRIWRNDGPPPLDPLPALTFEGAKRFRRDYRGTPVGGRGMSEAEVSGKDVWNFELHAGDLIYVPRGWAHEVWTEDTHSAHLTFGFQLVSWVDVLMAMVAQGSRSQTGLREALPVGFARVAPDDALVNERAASLLAQLQSLRGSEALEEVIGRWMHRDMEAPPKDEPPPDTPAIPSERLRRTGPAAFVSRADSVGLFRPSSRASEVWLPKIFAPALRFVATVEPGEFEIRDLPGVSPSSRRRLCALLMEQGYLEPVVSSGEESRA
ncbi:MAG: cupin domain-containing protein [Vicinamibacteria bacterium]